MGHQHGPDKLENPENLWGSIFGGRTVKISTVLFSLTAVALVVYPACNSLYINPLKEATVDVQRREAFGRESSQRLKNDYDALKIKYDSVLYQIKSPVLTYPTDNTTTGKLITFSWSNPDLSQHSITEIRTSPDAPAKISDLHAVIEVRSLKDGGKKTFTVLPHGQEKLTVPRRKFPSGNELIWRVIPSSGERSASNWSYFKSYNSIISRIKENKVILSGMSVSSIEKFGFFQNSEPAGFDVDLIEWVAQQLGERLDIKLKNIIVDIPWDELLTKLRNREVDMVISAMTSTQKREVEGVRFSHGYFRTRQTLIGLAPNSEKKNFKELVSNKTVGVIKRTTNEECANFLSSEYKFKVIAGFDTIPEIVAGLEGKKIDYAMVDDIYIKEFIDKEDVYSQKLEEQILTSLEPFYKSEYAQREEQYAIAVFDESSRDNDLLNLINAILDSCEGKEKISDLKKKWGLVERG